MQILDDKNNSELLQSVIAELAKARAELRCAEEDTRKIASRLGFLIVLANELINRQKD
jgi:hypothetical protein